LTNDKEVLDSERRRLENEKVELSLDLASVSAEKLEVERKMSEVEAEMNVLRQRITEAEAEIAAAGRDRESLEKDVSEMRDVAMKQQLSLNSKEQEIGELRSEVQGKNKCTDI